MTHFEKKNRSILWENMKPCEYVKRRHVFGIFKDMLRNVKDCTLLHHSKQVFYVTMTDIVLFLHKPLHFFTHFYKQNFTNNFKLIVNMEHTPIKNTTPELIHPTSNFRKSCSSIHVGYMGNGRVLRESHSFTDGIQENYKMVSFFLTFYHVIFWTNTCLN